MPTERYSVPALQKLSSVNLCVFVRFIHVFCSILCSLHPIQSDHGLGREGNRDPFSGDWTSGRRVHAQTGTKTQILVWKKWQGETVWHPPTNLESDPALSFHIISCVLFSSRFSLLLYVLEVPARSTSWHWVAPICSAGNASTGFTSAYATHHSERCLKSWRLNKNRNLRAEIPPRALFVHR